MHSPEKIFKMGAVRASVFNNPIQRDGRSIALRKVVLEVRYKDRKGQWQGTNSLSINDLPKAIAAMQQAYEYLLMHSSSQTSFPTSSAVSNRDGPPKRL